MNARWLTQWLIRTVLFSAFTFSAFVEIKNTPNFKGDIDHEKAASCIKGINKSKCKLKELFANYKISVQNLLVKQSVCQQSLTFFKLTDGGFLKKFVAIILLTLFIQIMFTSRINEQGIFW